MDRSLWLLLELRIKARIRSVGRMLRSVRGALLFIAGSCIFCLWILAPLLQTRHVTADHLADVRRYGPLVLVGIFLMNLVFSTGERAIAFTPAEVNLLFPAPFTRRQLLAYKLTASCGAAVLTACFLVLLLWPHVARLDAAFIGLSLTLVFMNLLTMFLALLASSIGASAYNRRRKIVLVGLVALLAAAVYQQGIDVLKQDWPQILMEVEQSPVVQVLLEPLRWFIQAATAERFWPDLVRWSALALLVDLCLAGLVFALDAQYLEASAAASEKTYARLQRARRGGAALMQLPASGRARFSLLALPNWGGLGPLAWRQLTTMLRGIWTIVVLVIIFSTFLLPALAKGGGATPSAALAWFVAWVTFFAAPLLPFDFRGDLDRMDVLKALPLAPWRVVAGQLLAPVLVLAMFQWIVLGLLQILTRPTDNVPLLMGVFLLPVNFLLFEIENIFFLWFPTRLSMSVADFQSMGRHMLLWIAKMMTLLVTVAAAFLAGLAAYFIGGHSWTAGLIVAWLVVAGVALGLIPLVALAFQHFDVAADVPP
jgi:Putative ABC exporter